MHRYEISDEKWERIKDLLPGKTTDPGRTAEDNRRFINGVFWIARSGAPWRDLPERYGKWNSVFKRFNRWSNIISKGAKVVIPARGNCKEKREIDDNLYKDRNKIERFFNRLKYYRWIATRYEKTGRNYLSFILVGAIMTLLL